MFAKLLVGALATLVALPAAVSAISIIGPTSDYYWVFGESNTIIWSASAGDPSPISITITNPDNSILNGQFSIAQGISVDTSSVTVTNVTLRPDSGYVVNFVNPNNGSDIYASSQSFTVQPAGTAPFGEVYYTIVSFTVVGTSTEAVTIVETSTTLTIETPHATSSTANSTTTGPTSSSTAAAGEATAQIISKTKSSGHSKHTASLVTAGAGLIGTVIGACLLL